MLWPSELSKFLFLTVSWIFSTFLENSPLKSDIVSLMREQLVGISSALANSNKKKFYKKLSPSEKSNFWVFWPIFKFFFEYSRKLPCHT